MMENRHFLIDAGIYPLNIYVFFGEIDYMLNTLIDEDTEALKSAKFGNGCSLISPKGTHILWCRYLPNTNTQIGVEGIAILSHEILHVTFTIQKEHGIKLSRKSEESFNYLNQYLTYQIYDKLNQI